MNLTDRRYIPYTIGLTLAAAVVIAYLAPAEAKLGNTVKLIYLHASITWIALGLFAIAGLIGLAALITRKEILSFWAQASLTTATVYWVGHFVLGLVVMKLAWGGWFWSEPRVKAGVLILGMAIAATLLASSMNNKWLSPLLSIGIAVFIVILLSTVGRIFHPQNAIFSSDSVAIKASVVLIIGLLATTSFQLMRLVKPSPVLKE